MRETTRIPLRGIDNMSAPEKKNLRSNRSGGALTEKQAAELKEAQKLRNYTIGFVVVLALLVVIAAFAAVNSLLSSSGYLDRKTVAVTIDGQDISSAELNYYYIDSINSFYNTLRSNYGDYAGLYGQFIYGIDFSKALGDQEHPDGGTWADYFVNQATQSAKSTYALCKAAKAEGISLNEDSQASLENEISMIGFYANLSGTKDSTAYLKAMYGNGATEESFRSYCEDSLLASQYYNSHLDSLVYDDAAIREAEKDKYNEYSSYTGNYYYISSSSFLQGGVEGEDGTITYSEEARAAALEAAKAAAEELTSRKYLNAEAFDKAIADMEINKGNNVSSTVFTNQLYSQVTSVIRDWITDSSRQAGDCTYLPSETTDSEGNTVVNGYYVAYFESVNDNTQPLANVRHLLVAFSGGTTDENGNKVYSDEEKAEALAKAEDYLAQWEAGEKTEDSFAAMVTELTDDTASKESGGLYQNISPASQYVENFLNWAMDDSRKPGDTGIVETEYGYHIMYYVGDSDLTYRDQMIIDDLKTADQNTWAEGIIASVEMTEKNTSRLNRNIVIGSSN